MRAVVQRVQRGCVTVDSRVVAQINHGYVILLGIGPQDTQDIARELARKIALLRVFEDDAGKMNLSVLDIKGEAIVVSQFTLYASTQKGNRPSFTDAAPPQIAQPLVDYFARCLCEQGIPTQQGEFGAHMVVDIVNDGPVTIQFEY